MHVDFTRPEPPVTGMEYLCALIGDNLCILTHYCEAGGSKDNVDDELDLLRVHCCRLILTKPTLKLRTRISFS